MIPGTVAIGYLDDGSNWAACFGISLRNLFLFDQAHKGRLLRGGEYRSIAGTGSIPEARNHVVKRFLDGDAEWLFFIDTDMGFTDDTVERLLKSANAKSKPVMGALCFANKGQRHLHTELNAERFTITPTVYEYLELEDEVGFRPLFDYKRDAVMEVSGTGSAAILIHRHVLGKIRDAFGDNWYTPITHPTGNKGGKPRTFGEDLSFCVRAAAVDAPLHIDTSIKTTHDKGGVFLDEETFDIQQSIDRDARVS